FDVAEVTQPVAEGVVEGLHSGGRVESKVSDPGDPLALLCARRDRPRRRAAEQRDERAALHSITSSAVPIIVAGASIPSDLAVLRLTARKILVGNSTSRSPGAVPRRILSTKVAPR